MAYLPVVTRMAVYERMPAHGGAGRSREGRPLLWSKPVDRYRPRLVSWSREVGLGRLAGLRARYAVDRLGGALSSGRSRRHISELVDVVIAGRGRANQRARDHLVAAAGRDLVVAGMAAYECLRRLAWRPLQPPPGVSGQGRLTALEFWATLVAPVALAPAETRHQPPVRLVAFLEADAAEIDTHVGEDVDLYQSRVPRDLVRVAGRLDERCPDDLTTLLSTTDHPAILDAARERADEMRRLRTTNAVFTPYKFVISLDSYREHRRLRADSSAPYFYMFLLDKGRDWGDPEFIERHRGHDSSYMPHAKNLDISCSRAEFERWTNLQNTVLSTLRGIEAELIHDLDTTKTRGSKLLERCYSQIRAIGLEHHAVWAELITRAKEAWYEREDARNRKQWPVPLWSDRSNRIYSPGPTSGYGPL
jgi:hypothetical protein